MGLNLLLIFIPIAAGLEWFEFNPIAVFLTSAVAIVPLASLQKSQVEMIVAPSID